MFRALTVTVVGLALATSGALGASRHDGDVATSPVAVARGADIAQQIAAYEAQVDRQPRNGRAWAILGHLYVEHARLEGDPTNYDKSRVALDRALSLDPDDDLALAGRAALSAAKHHFRQALRDARRALAVNPYQSVALSIRIDAMTELGRYPAQLRAIARADDNNPGTSVLTRRSYALELRGDLAGATRMLRKAYGLAMSPADRAYLLTQIAELDRKAHRFGVAERHLRQARSADPTYVPAWASQARLAVARGDLPDAERWWGKVAEAGPNFDSSLELGELYAVTGRKAMAAEQFAIARELVAAEAARGVHGELEMAQIEADFGSLTAALEAARKEWSRRQSVHVADALAWALYRNGHVKAALKYARTATRLGTPEAPMWLHRGLIEASLGMDSAARRHLARGASVDGGVRPVLAAEARAMMSRL